jgi:DNA polymerase-3 subunit delta
MPRLGPMSAWKPAYLIHGDDHGRIGERRANLRRKAEEEAGAQGVEAFEGDVATPVAIAAALSAMTFSMGHRFLVVDGVERWKDADVKAHVLPALKVMDPGTTIAFFGRDDGRVKTPAALRDAVRKNGGVVAEEAMLKARDLPGWVKREAEKLGLKLDNQAARLLVDAVGERQQRLLRELEKLAIEHGPGAQLGEEEVAAVAAPSAERQVWGLVDALVAREHRKATRAFLQLREQGESLPRLIPLIARRLREVLAVAVRLEAGESPAQVKSGLKMAPWAADQRLRDARGTDADALRTALESLADLELASRGMSDVSQDTAALRTLATIAG